MGRIFHKGYYTEDQNVLSIQKSKLVLNLMHCTHTVWNYIYVKQIDRLQDKEIICNCLTKKHSVYFLSCDSLLLFSLPGYDMSTFIRRYSRYLNEKAMSYRLVAVDFTKMKRGQGSAHTHTQTDNPTHHFTRRESEFSLWR